MRDACSTTPNSVLAALHEGLVETQTQVRMRYNGPYINLESQYHDQDLMHADLEMLDNQLIDTTVGRGRSE